jgi:hypothetical protein
MDGDQRFPTCVGGGDLWEEPMPARQPWWAAEWLYPALGALALLFIALSFFFVGLTFWLASTPAQ